MRESTRNVCTSRSYQQNTVRRGVFGLGWARGSDWLPPQTTIKRYA